MRLLIVDDSSIMRRTIEKNLSGYDIEIIGHAGNGIEALDIVTKYNPDVITLDITMPKMNGIECLDKIMKINPAIKVIIITALNDKLTGLMALEKGAKGFLFKPVKPEPLLRAFEKLIQL